MHILTTTAVLAALVAAGWCDAQSTVPRPRPFRPSFPSTPSSFPSTRRPSDELDNTIFSTDSDKNTFPSSGSSDGFFGSGQPGDIFVHNPSSQGFGNPSTSFGTPAPTTFGSQGGVIGQPVFLTPSNVFVGQPNTFSSQGFGQGGLGQGSFGQGSFGQGSFGQGSLGQGSFGQGSLGQGSFGQGSLGQGSFGQGSLGQGSFGQGSFGQGGFGQGSFGQGSFGQGGLGQGSFGQGSFGQPNSFSGQGVFRQPGTFTGQGVFGRPTVFATPVTIGTALPRQGGTTFNTGLGSGSTSGSSGRFPSNTQFGTLTPGSFGGAIPVIVGFTQGGIPVPGLLAGSSWFLTDAVWRLFTGARQQLRPGGGALGLQPGPCE
ncbi:ATP-dependent RNA helicase glh-2-like [Scylla paramamosain]|uniref:ATP-dependent RNA helicase glh-2-like n=1 Tax=Scylla paramamosain TaxID=85552 RepID=UPI003083796C